MKELLSPISDAAASPHAPALNAQQPIAIQYHEFTHADGEAPPPCAGLAWPLEAGCPILEDKRETRPHGHDYYELLLIVGGTAVHRTGHYAAAVERGDFIVTAPKQAHAFAEIDGLQRIECACLPEWFTHVPEDLWGEPGVLQLFLAPLRPMDARKFPVSQHRLGEEHLALCIAEFRAITRELHRKRPSLPYIRRCMSKLMILAGRSYAKVNDCDDFEWLSGDIVEALRIIEVSAATSELFNVAELAGRFSLSPGRFTRRFREAVGVSPYQYYQHRRIQHACWLLLNTRHTVTEVAFMLGFADSPHFERAFRSRRKMTPNAYRKRFGEKAT